MPQETNAVTRTHRPQTFWQKLKSENTKAYSELWCILTGKDRQQPTTQQRARVQSMRARVRNDLELLQPTYPTPAGPVDRVTLSPEATGRH